MSDSLWEEAVIALERASDRLVAAMPSNQTLLEDALERRAAAIERIRSLQVPPDTAILVRLSAALQVGDRIQEQLVLQREQLRDGIARLNHSTYLTQAFTDKSAGRVVESRKSLDCAG